MPALFWTFIRLGIYMGSILFGAALTTGVNKIISRARENRRRKRIQKKPFKGFDSEAHEHGQ